MELNKEIITDSINMKNILIYSRYYTSMISRNEEVKNTTYKTYTSNMKIFLRYLKQYEHNRLLTGKKTLEDMLDILDRYVHFCRYKLNNNNRTINNKITAISSFYSWATRRRVVPYHPFKDKWDPPKITHSDVRRQSYYLTVQNIWEVNYKMNNDKRFDLLDKLLFNIIIDSACRITALQNLKFSQLKLSQGYFENVREKEGYIVSVLIFEESKRLLEELLQFRKERGIDEDFIFISRYNGKYNKMSQETIRSRIRKIGRIINIDKLYPHSLRKSSVNLISKAGELSDGALLANHKNIAVTQMHYVQKFTHLEKRKQIQSIRDRAGL